MDNAFKSYKTKTKEVTNKHLNISVHYNCRKPEMYMHYVCTYTEDNSKPEVIPYETFWFLLNCNKKYFTKILTTFRPTESARVLGSWQFHDTNEEKQKCIIWMTNKVRQMHYSLLNNMMIILNGFFSHFNS